MKKPPGKPIAIQVIQSVLAAMFGVQSSKNRQRDFSTGPAGKEKYYILGAIVFMLVFVFTLLFIIKLVIP